MNGIKEPKPMNEIHLIREKIFNEIKSGSVSELMKYIHETSVKFEKTLNKKKLVSVK